MPLELEKITESQLKALPREQTVFFFPVGGLEDHGPHLPLGLDLAHADKLCWLAAERLEKEMQGWQGVVMPRAPLSVDAETSAIAITVRAFVLRDWLVDASIGLSKHGFRHFACFSGSMGPKQLTAIEEVATLIRLRSSGNWYRRFFGQARPKVTFVSASSATVSRDDVKRSALWPDPVEHGGPRDTSIALAVVPEQVDRLYQGLPAGRRPDSRWERFRARLGGKTAGYWGDPTDATAEHGQVLLSGDLDQVFPKMRAVWEGAKPGALFRSGYGFFVSNRSFFKAWVLSFGIFMILMLWVYVNLSWIMG